MADKRKRNGGQSVHRLFEGKKKTFRRDILTTKMTQQSYSWAVIFSLFPQDPGMMRLLGGFWSPNERCFPTKVHLVEPQGNSAVCFSKVYEWIVKYRGTVLCLLLKMNISQQVITTSTRNIALNKNAHVYF